MGQTAKVTRKNRTITVDFHNEATYDQLLDDTKAFVEFVLAFLLALGFQLLHKGIVKLTPYGRTRALARYTPWSRRCILDTPAWACRRYIPREIWPHRQRYQ